MDIVKLRAMDHGVVRRGWFLEIRYYDIKKDDDIWYNKMIIHMLFCLGIEHYASFTCVYFKLV